MTPALELIGEMRNHFRNLGYNIENTLNIFVHIIISEK